MGRGLTTVLVGGLAVAIVLSTATPVPVGVVDSDSMAPTLEPGERYLALPPGLVGGVDVGDVVVFHGADGWTVHRVVDETEAGLLTAGDANVLTDQDDGAPAVAPAAVAGVVPAVDGRLVAGQVGWVVPWLAAVAGLGLGVGWGRPREPIRPPRPTLLGGLVAATVGAGWFVRGGLRPGRSVDSIRNGGPLPLVVVEGGTLDASGTVLWPGESRSLGRGRAVGTVHGWVPADALAVVDRPSCIVVLAAVSTGLVAAALAATVGWFLPPIEDR